MPRKIRLDYTFKGSVQIDGPEDKPTESCTTNPSGMRKSAERHHHPFKERKSRSLEDAAAGRNLEFRGDDALKLGHNR